MPAFMKKRPTGRFFVPENNAGQSSERPVPSRSRG